MVANRLACAQWRRVQRPLPAFRMMRSVAGRARLRGDGEGRLRAARGLAALVEFRMDGSPGDGRACQRGTIVTRNSMRQTP